MRAVARLANVSMPTVSRTINHVHTVDPKLAKRVWKVINEYGYTPNAQSRALGSGRPRLLGLIISETTNRFFPDLIQAFEGVAVESGYEILIKSTNYSPDTMNTCIRHMIDRRAEGVAVMTFGIEEPGLYELTEHRLPMVFADLSQNLPGIGFLRIDNQQGIRQGVQHLAALGHRDIAFIAGPLRLHSPQSRLSAFESAIRECGITVDANRIIEGDHTMEGGVRAAELLFRGRGLPTAVMCSNDMTGIGVLHEAYRAGLRVPDDLSVVGFDNIHIAQMTIPPLTTIQVSSLELAQSAVTALRAYLEGGPTPMREYRVGTRLVPRESSSFPRGTLTRLRELKSRDSPTGQIT